MTNSDSTTGSGESAAEGIAEWEKSGGNMTSSEHPSNEGRRPVRSPLVTILIFFFLFALLYAVAYVVIGFEANLDTKNGATYRELQGQLGNAATQGWIFVRPLLQLSIVLAIVMWAAERYGLRFNLGLLEGDQGVKAVIAIAIVAGFVLAGLGGLGAVAALKDVALVIVGFYFGSRAPRAAGQPASDEEA